MVIDTIAQLFTNSQTNETLLCNISHLLLSSAKLYTTMHFNQLTAMISSVLHFRAGQWRQPYVNYDLLNAFQIMDSQLFDEYLLAVAI